MLWNGKSLDLVASSIGLHVSRINLMEICMSCVGLSCGLPRRPRAAARSGDGFVSIIPPIENILLFRRLSSVRATLWSKPIALPLAETQHKSFGLFCILQAPGLGIAMRTTDFTTSFMRPPVTLAKVTSKRRARYERTQSHSFGMSLGGVRLRRSHAPFLYFRILEVAYITGRSSDFAALDHCGSVMAT